jgi:hypothetical protein
MVEWSFDVILQEKGWSKLQIRVIREELRRGSKCYHRFQVETAEKRGYQRRDKGEIGEDRPGSFEGLLLMIKVERFLRAIHWGR